MKGFLTFTLAAGVAITTTSVAQAAGVAKGAMNADRTASTQSQGPMSIGAMSGFSLDRMALNRELNRLANLLEPTDPELVEAAPSDAPAKKKSGYEWTY